MPTGPKVPSPTFAKVNPLIHDTSTKLDTSEELARTVAEEHDETVASVSPTNWWLYGIIGLAIVIAMLLILQLFNGAPGTDMQPGSPVSEPVVEPVAPAP